MPGADLLFLPLPFASAARGNGAGPRVSPARDAGDAAAPRTWQEIAGERARALRTIVALGDVAAGGRTPGDGLNARLIPGTDPARVSVVADAWNAMRMAMIDAGLQVMLDDEL